jgi:muramidase (phage lysozyme)
MARDDDQGGGDLLRAFGLMNAAGLGPGAVTLAKPSAPLDRIPEISVSSGPQPVQNLDIPAQGRALLATIGGPGFESNGTYGQRFGGPDITDFSKHPAIRETITSGPNKGNWTDAAGRYQFISTTFADQAKKLGLTDFSPKSQDAAAWNLAKETYAGKYKGRDLTQDLANPAYLPKILSALKTQWSSLPGGVEQSSAGGKGFAKTYDDNLKGEQARASPPPSPSPLDRLVQARAGVTG